MNPFAKMEGAGAPAVLSVHGAQPELPAKSAARSAQVRLHEINVSMLVAMKAARDRLQPIQIAPIAAELSQRMPG